MSERAALAALLRERSVSFGEFKLASGRTSRFYIDARKTTMSAPGQLLIGRLGLAAIRLAGWAPDTVGGLTLGADPVAYAIARASAEDPPTIHAFSVRKAAKDHGTGKLIEGNLGPGQSAVVVEDVITTGGSALQAVKAVRGAGATVLGVLAVVDRLEGGRTALEEAGLIVVVLTTILDFGIEP